ncbi:zinc finger protein ZFMSA12A [Oncorhynchus kisutch]|uniref:Zinc finger protein ZFMSA12A-like n=1 Tax=Oncorhynchus kisutch TaxID=8019 RepID=A0A8C7DCG5_ONCKI|nr:zinc finger protein ZFMSA12A-like [Oncorhynchus kisutch]
MRRSLAKVAKILIGTWAIMDSPIPLSSLRLLVPPLRLMSAFMWQVAQQRAIKHYGKLEEFVTVVTQTVTELMTDRQRTLLILGLRARVNPVSLQTLLYRIKSSQHAQSNDAGMESPEANFAKLTQNLIIDPVEREHFVQVVFPEEFRPDFDQVLQELVCDFLTRLEELLTLPDFKQTALLLSAGSSGLDECLQSFSHSEDLQFLLQNYKQCRTLYTNISSSDIPQESDIESDAFPDQLNRTNLDTGVGMRTGTQSRDCQRMELASHLVEMGSTRDIIGCDETCDEGNEDDIDVEDDPKQKRAGSGLSPTSVVQGGDTDTAGVSFQVLTPLSSASNECAPSTSSSSHMVVHQCPQCGKCFNYQSQLVQHQQIHCGDNPYKCSNCGNRFKFFTSLSNHKRMQCVGTAFSCPKCWREFGSLREKLRHQCPHNEVMYICPQSGKSFKTPQQQPFQCRHCAMAFSEMDQLHAHEKIHGVPQSLDCHTCGMTFSNLPSLVHHVEAHKRSDLRPSSHLPKKKKGLQLPKTHHCHQCGKSFVTNRRLKDHVRTHLNYRPFPCSYCGKCFTQKGNLNVHIRIHTGERPYMCSVCGKTFQSAGNLQVHQRFHTGEKPYQCKECDKRFTKSSHLVVHMRGHTGERPFTCNECGRSFIRKTCLKKHLLVHSGQKPYSRPRCPNNSKRSSQPSYHMKENPTNATAMTGHATAMAGHAAAMAGHVAAVAGHVAVPAIYHDSLNIKMLAHVGMSRGYAMERLGGGPSNC